MTDVRHAAGQRGEDLAAEHLERLGFQILARNHRTRFGELDLVAYDGDVLVFVEVKTRRSDSREPWENLHDRKRSQVRRMAIAWLTEGSDRPYSAQLRFDGIAVLLDARRSARAPRPPRGGVLMLARVMTFAVDGVDARRVWVEADIRQGLPAFTVVGLADKAVREARERVRAALVNSGYEFPLRRITVNLAPAYLRKVGPAFDLPLAVALLVASYQLAPEAVESSAVIGELSLTGEVRAVRGVLAVAEGVRRAELDRLVVPRSRAREAALVPGIEVVGVDSLQHLVATLRGDVSRRRSRDEPPGSEEPDPELADVRGHNALIPGLEVAAAGGHNLFLQGPPGHRARR